MRRRKLDKLQVRERNDSLNKLHFSYYKDYLRSPLWKGIRRKVLERDGGKCKFCEEKATAVHHSSYDFDTMRGEKLIHLHSCCSHCHYGGHKHRRAEKPDNTGRCPRCNKKNLTEEEAKINKIGQKNQKTVCKICRGTIRLQYKKDNNVFEAPDYHDLPKYYHFHFNRSI